MTTENKSPIHGFTLREACDYTVGAASTCWAPDTGDAVFDSDRAIVVSTDLQKYIVDEYDSLLNPNRSKGESIVADCILSGEPFFVFRARDIFSPMILKQYMKVIEDYGPDDPDFQATIVNFINELRKWQTQNVSKVRYPD